MLARLILLPTGLLLGAATAVVVLPLLALVDPVTRSVSGLIGHAGLMSLLAAASGDAGAVATYGAALSSAVIAVCIVPLIIVALIGEVARVGSLVWYAGGTGLAAAIMPFVLRAGYGTSARGSVTSVEQRFLMLFFITGALSGLVYWAVAGRGALRKRRVPRADQGLPNVSSKE